MKEPLQIKKRGEDGSKIITVRIKEECKKRMPDCSGILINLIELSTNLN